MPHPLVETFAGASGRCFGAHLGERPTGEWLDAAALSVDAAALEPLMALAAAGYATDRRDIKGVRLVEIWTWLVASPAAASMLLDRRVPDLAAANLEIAAGLYAESWPIALRARRFWCLPGDPAAGHPDATVLDDEAALLGRLNATLAEHHLAPLIETVATMTARPRRALWRSAADRLVNAFTWSGEQLDQAAEGHRLGAMAVAAPGRLNATARMRTFRFDGLPPWQLHLRDGCCLYYRIPDAPKCLGCPLVDDSERARRAEAELREKLDRPV